MTSPAQLQLRLPRGLPQTTDEWQELHDDDPDLYRKLQHHLDTIGELHSSESQPIPDSPGALAAQCTSGREHQRAHLDLIDAELRACRDGAADRVGIFMPPQVGKSRRVAEWGAAWLLSTRPDWRVAVASYAAHLARKRGRFVRNLLTAHPELGLTVARGSAAVDDWDLDGHRGGMKSVGVGGGLTGDPVDAGIIDDPVKDRQEADSPVVREAVYGWYRDVFEMRMGPTGFVVLMMCMTGDTPVLRPDGTETPLREIRPGDRIATYESGRLGISTVVNWASQGSDRIFRIRMKSGRTVRANARHPFLTVDGGTETWRRTSELRAGVYIRLATGDSTGVSPAPPTTATSQPCARGCARPTTARPAGRLDTGRPRPSPALALAVPRSSDTATASASTTTSSSLPTKAGCAPSAVSLPTSPPALSTGPACSALTMTMTAEPSAACCATDATSPSATDATTPASCAEPLSTWNVAVDEVVAVEPAGVEEVFDVQVDRTENFIANGLVSHNTRWHEDDLGGRLIAEEGLVQNGGRWRIVNVPALAEPHQPVKHPETGEIVGPCLCGRPLDRPHDPLGRVVGEPITHPTMDREEYRRRAERTRVVSPRTFAALLQQRPTPLEGGLVGHDLLRKIRVPADQLPEMRRRIVALDPSGGGQDEAGVVAGGLGIDARAYLTHDRSARMSAAEWGRAACQLAYEIGADAFVVEKNYGGDQAGTIVRQAWAALEIEGALSGLCPRIVEVSAKKGKVARAEPVAQAMREDRVGLAGVFPELEEQWATYQQGMDSPDRLDASVYLVTELLPRILSGPRSIASPSTLTLPIRAARR